MRRVNPGESEDMLLANAIITSINKLLEPLPDAAVGVSGDKICLMNQAARDLLGDQTGKPAAEVLPADVLAMGGGAITDSVLAGQRMSVQSVEAEGLTLYYISRVYKRDISVLLDELRSRKPVLSAVSNLLGATRQVVLDLEDDPREELRMSASASMHMACQLARQLFIEETSEQISGPGIITNIQPTDVTELVRDLVSTIRYLARPRGIEVLFEGGYDEARCEADVDVYWLEVALLNLISICLTRMAGGEGSYLTLGVSCEAGTAVFSVDAQGPANPESESDTRCFQLAVDIAKLHGGTCVSTLGDGVSRFLLSVPVKSQLCDSPYAGRAIYGAPDMNLILVQLSDWLRNEDYDPRLLD